MKDPVEKSKKTEEEKIKYREEIYYDPLIKLLFNFFGSLLPLIITIPIIILTTKWTGFNFFLDKGQFCLYSASFFSPTIYLLYKYKGKNTFDKYLLIFMLTCLGILLCIVIYTVLRMGEFVQNPETEINTRFLQWISIVLFIGSLVVLFFAQSLENKRNLELKKFDYKKATDNSFNDFKDQFNNEG